MSQVETDDIVNIIICVSIAQLFDSAVVGSRKESLVVLFWVLVPKHPRFSYLDR